MTSKEYGILYHYVRKKFNFSINQLIIYYPNKLDKIIKMLSSEDEEFKKLGKEALYTMCQEFQKNNKKKHAKFNKNRKS